jgi:hypothetical protein
VLAVAIALVLLLIPVAYIELGCRGEGGARAYTPLITDASFHRPEANSFLTYPEWHIVFAYDGLAHTLASGDEHAFDYADSVAGFWRSACTLMRAADAHGGADWGTRSTIHTIGVSFTVEMALKAAYEETVGRLTAWARGGTKTPQDRVVAEMAADYAAFLRQTPWYEYPFPRERAKLWAAPMDGVVRGWERRLGIGVEFTAKAVYARAIAGAVAATGKADLTIRSVVAGLDLAALAGIPDVQVVARRDRGVEIETPRYDRFTRILAEIAGRGGTILEIAGNDDIMVTLTASAGDASPIREGRVLLRLKRDGFAGDRLIVDLPVRRLAAFLRAHPIGDPGLEHVFDY